MQSALQAADTRQLVRFADLDDIYLSVSSPEEIPQAIDEVTHLLHDVQAVVALVGHEQPCVLGIHQQMIERARGTLQPDSAHALQGLRFLGARARRDTDDEHQTNGQGSDSGYSNSQLLIHNVLLLQREPVKTIPATNGE
jgi:hypothetical protein